MIIPLAIIINFVVLLNVCAFIIFIVYDDIDISIPKIAYKISCYFLLGELLLGILIGIWIISRDIAKHVVCSNPRTEEVECVEVNNE